MRIGFATGFWLLLDLDELPRLAARLRLFSHNRFNLFAFRPDHGDGSARRFASRPSGCCAQAGIEIAGGPIRLLCMPRTLGYGFNPLSIYFCHRPDGEARRHDLPGPQYVRRTPWLPDRRLRRNPAGSGSTAARRSMFRLFMDMDMATTSGSAPDERIASASAPAKRPSTMFTAALAGKRRELTDRALLQPFLSMPPITLKVTLAFTGRRCGFGSRGCASAPDPRPRARVITRSRKPTKLD